MKPLVHTGTVEILTPRLRLRKFVPGDAEAVFRNWSSDPQVTRHISWQPHQTVEVTRDLLAGWIADYEKPDAYNWGIEFEGTLIGSIGAHQISERDQSCSVGYCIGKEWWGRGLVTEALDALLRHLLLEAGFHRVSCQYDVENPASGRVMEKCGMKREGILRGSFRRSDGAFVDCVVCGILTEDLEPTA